MLFLYIPMAFQYVDEGNTMESVDGAMTRFGRRPSEMQGTTAAEVSKGFFLKDGNVDPDVLSFIAKWMTKEQPSEDI